MKVRYQPRFVLFGEMINLMVILSNIVAALLLGHAHCYTDNPCHVPRLKIQVTSLVHQDHVRKRFDALKSTIIVDKGTIKNFL